RRARMGTGFAHRLGARERAAGTGHRAALRQSAAAGRAGHSATPGPVLADCTTGAARVPGRLRARSALSLRRPRRTCGSRSSRELAIPHLAHKQRRAGDCRPVIVVPGAGCSVERAFELTDLAFGAIAVPAVAFLQLARQVPAVAFGDIEHVV